MQKNDQKVSTQKGSKNQRSMILALAMILALVFSSFNLQAASATSGDEPDQHPELKNKVYLPLSFGLGSGQAAAANTNAEVAQANAVGGACASQNWIEPTGGDITIKGRVDGSNESSGTMIGVLNFNGQQADAFCTDFHHSLTGTNTMCLDQTFFSDWRVTWLIQTYPPHRTDRVQQAARQAAVWHFTDGFDLRQNDPTTEGNSVDTAVWNAYTAILLAIPDEAPASYQPGNLRLVIEPANATYHLLNASDQPQPLVARLTKGGTGLPNVTINLSTTRGTLNQASGVTDSKGEVAFTIKHNTTGSGTITASATVDLPAGSRFNHQSQPTEKQRLVMAGTVSTLVTGQSEVEWVDNNRTIVAHKFEDLNFNGIQDEGEKGIPDVKFQLYLDSTRLDTSVTGWTDSEGKATFTLSNSSFKNGTYTLKEIGKWALGWYNPWVSSTPDVQTRVRSASDSWTFWQAEFGNSSPHILKVINFLDENGDGVKQASEPPLPDFQFELRNSNGTLGGGTSDLNGQLGFTGLEEGSYTVIQRPVEGYINTTPMTQTVNIQNSDVSTLTFGSRLSAYSLWAFKYYEEGGESGKFDNGDYPISGWNLCQEGGNCKSTDTNGLVSWTSARPGSARITESLSGSWQTSTPLSQEWPFAPGNYSSTPGPKETTITIPDGSQYQISFVSNVGTTWTYHVKELSGKSLSHWDLGIATCFNHINASTPSGAEFGQDGQRPFWGAKWNLNDSFTEGDFSFTLDKNYPAGTIEALMKAGSASGGFETGQIYGPLCGPQFGNFQLAGLEVTKNVQWGTVTPNPDQRFEICVTGPYPQTTQSCHEYGATTEVYTFTNLVPGSYTVQETTPGKNWAITGSPVTVTLGEQSSPVQVTVTNTFQTGELYLTKDVIWNGVPREVSRFNVCITGPLNLPGFESQKYCHEYNEWTMGYTFANLVPGNYLVVEDDPGIYWNIIQGNNQIVTVTPNATKWFAVKNSHKLGNLQVAKQVDWNGLPEDQRDTSATFEICITGPGASGTESCQNSTYTNGSWTAPIWSNLLPGTYTVSEKNTSSQWAATVSPDAAVTVPADGTVQHVTLTNRRMWGSVQVEKVVDWKGITADTTESFQICLTGPAPATTRSCQDADFDGETLTWNYLTPGTYTLSEGNPGNEWTTTYSTQNIVVLDNATTPSATATVTNTRKLGSIELTKEVLWGNVAPIAGQTFRVCIAGPSEEPAANQHEYCEVFDNDGGTKLWENLLPGTYTVTEDALGSTWSVGVNPASVVVPPTGGVQKAKVTNTFLDGSLTVTKLVQWGQVPQDTTQKFSICVEGPSFTSPNCKEIGSAGGSLSWSDLIPGDYTVTEQTDLLGDNWIVNGSGVTVTVNPSPAPAAAATITNTYNPGGLTVVKQINAAGASIDPAQTFQFCITGPSYPTTPECKVSTYDDTARAWEPVTFSSLIPGDYQVSENETLLGGNWTVAGNNQTVTVSAGQTASHTITNTLVPGSLEVVKAINWAGTPVKTDEVFEFCITGPSYPTTPECKVSTYDGVGAWTPVTFNPLQPGTYNVTEKSTGSNWTVVGSDETVTVEASKLASHTITNTLVPGSLVVHKVVNTGDVQPTTLEEFEICITGPSYPTTPECRVSTYTDNDQWSDVTFEPLFPGLYTITESDPGPNWAAVSSSSVTVAAGTQASSTVTNTLIPGRLVVAKAVEWSGITPDLTQTFEFCIEGPLTPEEIQTGVVDPSKLRCGEPSSYDSEAGQWSPITFEPLYPGSYRVTEKTDLLGSSWTVTGSGEIVVVPPMVNNENGVTHTITNTRKLGKLEVTKEVFWRGVTPSAQSFEICLTGPSFTQGPDCKTIDEQGGKLLWENLIPGEYTVTETVDGDVWSVVIDGSPVTVPADGGTATARVTNTHRLGSLEITKTVVWDSATPDINKTFEICIQGPSFAEGRCENVDYDGGVLTFNNLIPGDYLITETNPGSQWTVTGSGVTVQIPSGGFITHQISNVENPVPPVIDLIPALDSVKYDTLLNDLNHDGKAEPGALIQYTVLITNTGAGDALNVVFSDTPDANTSLVIGSVTTNSGAVIKGNTEGDVKVEVQVGKIPGKGGSVKIVFNVKVDDPLDPGVLEIANQGMITSDNHTTFPTDDPDTNPTDDPTKTPVVVVPTAVDSVEFTIDGISGTQVFLAWNSRGEINNVGFYIYRARVNDQTAAEQIAFVPSAAEGNGAYYTYTDVVPEEGQWYYWLVDVDSNNNLTWHSVEGIQTYVGKLNNKIFLPMVIGSW